MTTPKSLHTLEYDKIIERLAAVPFALSRSKDERKLCFR